MRFLDADLKTPTWTEVGVSFMVAVGLSFLLTLLIAPAVDFLVDGLIGGGDSVATRSQHQRFFFFLFVGFLFQIVRVSGVSIDKTPKAYWFSFWAIAIFMVFRG